MMNDEHQQCCCLSVHHQSISDPKSKPHHRRICITVRVMPLAARCASLAITKTARDCCSNPRTPTTDGAERRSCPGLCRDTLLQAAHSTTDYMNIDTGVEDSSLYRAVTAGLVAKLSVQDLERRRRVTYMSWKRWEIGITDELFTSTTIPLGLYSKAISQRAILVQACCSVPGSAAKMAEDRKFIIYNGKAYTSTHPVSSKQVWWRRGDRAICLFPLRWNIWQGHIRCTCLGVLEVIGRVCCGARGDAIALWAAVLPPPPPPPPPPTMQVSLWMHQRIVGRTAYPPGFMSLLVSPRRFVCVSTVQYS